MKNFLVPCSLDPPASDSSPRTGPSLLKTMSFADDEPSDTVMMHQDEDGIQLDSPHRASLCDVQMQLAPQLETDDAWMAQAQPPLAFSAPSDSNEENASSHRIPSSGVNNTLRNCEIDWDRLSDQPPSPTHKLAGWEHDWAKSPTRIQRAFLLSATTDPLRMALQNDLYPSATLIGPAQSAERTTTAAGAAGVSIGRYMSPASLAANPPSTPPRATKQRRTTSFARAQATLGLSHARQKSISPSRLFVTPTKLLTYPAKVGSGKASIQPAFTTSTLTHVRLIPLQPASASPLHRNVPVNGISLSAEPVRSLTDVSNRSTECIQRSSTSSSAYSHGSSTESMKPASKPSSSSFGWPLSSSQLKSDHISTSTDASRQTSSASSSSHASERVGGLLVLPGSIDPSGTTHTSPDTLRPADALESESNAPFPIRFESGPSDTSSKRPAKRAQKAQSRKHTTSAHTSPYVTRARMRSFRVQHPTASTESPLSDDRLSVAQILCNWPQAQTQEARERSAAPSPPERVHRYITRSRSAHTASRGDRDNDIDDGYASSTSSLSEPPNDFAADSASQSEAPPSQPLPDSVDGRYVKLYDAAEPWMRPLPFAAPLLHGFEGFYQVS